LIAFGYNFALNFIREDLRNVDEANVKELVSQVAQKLYGFNEFIAARMAQVSGELKDAYRIIECPRCWQEAMVLGDGNSRCLFCGAEPAPAELAHELRTVGEPDMCPECGGVCVPLIVGPYDATTWQCLSCGESGNYERCSKCNQLISGDPYPGDHCEGCWQYILEKND